MTTHTEVVIATPDRHLPLFFQTACEVISHGKLTGQAIHSFKHAIGVVALLFNNLSLKKVIVLKAGHCYRRRRQIFLNEMDEAIKRVMKLLVLLTQKEQCIQ